MINNRVGIAHPVQFLIYLRGSLQMPIDVNNIEKQIRTTLEDIARNNNFGANGGIAKSTDATNNGSKSNGDA